VSSRIERAPFPIASIGGVAPVALVVTANHSEVRCDPVPGAAKPLDTSFTLDGECPRRWKENAMPPLFACLVAAVFPSSARALPLARLVARAHAPAGVLALSSALLLCGCTFGTVARIYATSGSDISLTDTDRSEIESAVCPHRGEPSYLHKAAGAVSSMKDLVTGAEHGQASTGLPGVSSAAPTCESFEIHERIAFDST
jgi:hypothetical protein